MSMTKYAELVIAISTGPNSPKIFKKVGVILAADPAQNDSSKGPGFLILLDKTFNPAGMPDTSPTSVPISVYWPDDRKPQNPPKPARNLDHDPDPFNN